jgi:hypothetical protein
LALEVEASKETKFNCTLPVAERYQTNFYFLLPVAGRNQILQIGRGTSNLAVSGSQSTYTCNGGIAVHFRQAEFIF